MRKEELVEELYLQNPWWTDGTVPLPQHTIPRAIQSSIMERLEEKRVTGIVGLRRVGKTTLLKLVIQALLSDVPPERICYFSFDLASEVDPRMILQTYTEEILRESYSTLTEKIYLFFDEIQKVKDWGNQIKSIYDKGFDIKFIVTGSSSVNLTKGVGESLVGRITIQKLRPFSLSEFLRYQGIETPDVSFQNVTYPRDASRYRIAFREYMEQGGLPEMYDTYDPENLKQMLDLVFFRDIVDMFTVKRTDVLKGLFRLIAEQSGQKINYSNLSRDLDTQYQTLTEYIQHLLDSFLVHESRPYEESHLKALRKNPKLYVADHAYANLWRCKPGLVAQTVAFNHLERLEPPMYMAKPEIDIVLPERGYAFEVKYGAEVSSSDARSLTTAPREYTLFLVTRDQYDTWTVNGRTVQVIPLWLLCLLT